MPAYNKEEHIAESILQVKAKLDQFAQPYEIIVVNDGSADQTWKVASSVVSDSRVKVLGYERNQGKGWAARYGLRYASGDMVVLIDSDQEVSVEGLKLYLKALRNADIAIASKRHPRSQVNTPVLRRFLSYGFNVVVQIATGVRLSDTQAGLKAIRGQAIRRILPMLSVKRYAYDVELLAVASLLKMKVAELPVKIHLKALFSARQIFRILIDLMGITYRLRVKRWYQKNLDNPNANYKPILRW